MGPQLLANALSSAACYALVGIGFALQLRVARFFNFGHAALFAASPYLAWTFKAVLGLPLPISALLAVASTAILGCLCELAVYRPLRHKGASSFVLLLASLGMYVIVQNLLSITFGDDIMTIRSGAITEGLYVLGARITPIQIVIILAALVVTTALSFLLRTTRIGGMMRAVTNDPELASVSGIDSDRAILWSFGIGSALAACAGILVGLDIDLKPTMGMRPLMMGVVAVIVSGGGSIPGIALGALLLAMAQHLGVWKMSSQWQDVIAFAILLAFLVFRPQGVFGKRAKTATI